MRGQHAFLSDFSNFTSHVFIKHNVSACHVEAWFSAKHRVIDDRFETETGILDRQKFETPLVLI